MNGLADWIGYLASCLVLGTFCVRDMTSLRSCALASNLAFITYGAIAEIRPVLVLHLILLPTNAIRLLQQLGDAHKAVGASAARPPQRLEEEETVSDQTRIRPEHEGTRKLAGLQRRINVLSTCLILVGFVAVADAVAIASRPEQKHATAGTHFGAADAKRDETKGGDDPSHASELPPSSDATLMYTD